MSDLARTIEALLFLSSQPVSAADLAEASEATEGQVAEAIDVLQEILAPDPRPNSPGPKRRPYDSTPRPQEERGDQESAQDEHEQSNGA